MEIVGSLLSTTIYLVPALSYLVPDSEKWLCLNRCYRWFYFPLILSVRSNSWYIMSASRTVRICLSSSSLASAPHLPWHSCWSAEFSDSSGFLKPSGHSPLGSCCDTHHGRQRSSPSKFASSLVSTPLLQRQHSSVLITSSLINLSSVFWSSFWRIEWLSRRCVASSDKSLRFESIWLSRLFSVSASSWSLILTPHDRQLMLSFMKSTMVMPSFSFPSGSQSSP